jgi:sec-independent protein translocase protein TatB
MLDVGFSEILLTSAIALIVLGPERLPKVARQVGNWMGRARAMARQLSEQLEREVSAEELLKIQSKPSPGTNLPKDGSTVDPAYTPSIAPPPRALAPHPTSVAAMHPTSAAAMHAADPPPAEASAPDTASAPPPPATEASTPSHE